MKFIDSDIDPAYLVAVSPIDEQRVRVPGKDTGLKMVGGRPAKAPDKIVTEYCLTIVLGSTTMGVISIMEGATDKGIAEASRARLVAAIKENEQGRKA